MAIKCSIVVCDQHETGMVIAFDAERMTLNYLMFERIAYLVPRGASDAVRMGLVEFLGIDIYFHIKPCDIIHKKNSTDFIHRNRHDSLTLIG